MERGSFPFSLEESSRTAMSFAILLPYTGWNTREMRSEPSLPLSHQENVSPVPQGGQSYVILARRWLPPLSAGRCLDVSLQSWHWVWSLQQPHVRKHCRSLIKLSIRQRDTRLICLTYGFRHFSFVLFFLFFFSFCSALSEDELYLCVSSKRLR